MARKRFATAPDSTPISAPRPPRRRRNWPFLAHGGVCMIDDADEVHDLPRIARGRGGRPWAQLHADKRCKHLKWWANRLGLSSLGDLVDILPCVENASWTKNRTGGFQKLPGSLVARLPLYPGTSTRICTQQVSQSAHRQAKLISMRAASPTST